jgi:hypothetical protein
MLSLVAARRRQLKRIEVLRDAGPFDGFCLTSTASLARLDVQNLIREIGLVEERHRLVAPAEIRQKRGKP